MLKKLVLLKKVKEIGINEVIKRNKIINNNKHKIIIILTVMMIFIIQQQKRSEIKLICHQNLAPASSTVSVVVHGSVSPPTTISWLLGRTAVKQLYRPVVMWLIISHELVVESYA